MRISKHKNILSKGYQVNWSHKIFVIKKVKNVLLEVLTLAKGPTDDMINSVFKPEKKVYY